MGGCVRDLRRGAVPHDWDICTSAKPEETGACFPGRARLDMGRKFGTIGVVLDGQVYEVTTYRAEGTYSDGRRPDSVRFISHIEEDLARRDFTINAMAMDLAGELRDPFGGAADLKEGLIRCVGEPEHRFREDGLRIMRALRFAAVLGYRLEEGTERALRQERGALDGVAAERVQAELRKLLTGDWAGEVLRRYPEVFCRFWPELKALVTLEQRNPHHRWGGWEHTIQTLEHVPPEDGLRLAALLHDVGKPGTKTTDGAGVDHFYGHEKLGAELADGMLRRLRFDRPTREGVVGLVALHGVELAPTERAVRRWLNRLGPDGLFRLLALKRADIEGLGRDDIAEERLEQLERLRVMAEDVLRQGKCFSQRDLSIRGEDVLAAGIPEGPEVGEILREMLELVMAGELPNERETLLAYLSKKQEEG